MPYANPLDPTSPSGGSNANQLDDRIRELKAALIERLLTIVTDVNAQPLVLKPDIVTASAILADAVGQAEIANNAVGTAELIDRNITAIKIALLAITSAEIADNAITQLKMADNSVGTAELIDGSVTDTKLASNSVTNVKMANDSVDNAEIVNGAVNEPKLANLAVGTAKIADTAVTQPKLAAALESKLITMVSGVRVLTQSETTLATGEYREHDIDVTGAVVGRPCFASWVAIAPSVYPTSTAGSVGPAGWVPGDEMRIAAWCITAGKVKIRIKNLSGGTIDMGANGASLTAYQLKYITD